MEKKSIREIRRVAREFALFVLYACDMRNEEQPKIIFDSIVENGFIKEEEAEGEPLSADSLTYAKKLVFETLAKLEQTDEIISSFAANWELKRMAAIDRNILRMSVTEFSMDVPYKVVIDEAVEIAKIYGNEESGKFVNGLLDSIHNKHFK